MEIINKAGGLKGKIKVPGDKSISHRAIMLGSLAEGITEIQGFLTGADCLSTISCFRDLGVQIDRKGENVIVHGAGLYGLKEPENVLDVANSGTTIRLISGILSGQNFTAILTGDSSIRRRPMKRIITPLSLMGASFLGRENNNKAPFALKGGELQSIVYETPVASAQIKSAILLAGLYADGKTTVIEPEKSRNHSEVMLRGFGAEVEETENSSSIVGKPRLVAQNIIIPGDISSAAFFMVAGLIVPDSEILIENVGLNETRTGIIEVLLQMGGQIEMINERESSGEKVGDLLIRSSKLKSIEFGGKLIPRLVDEIPVIAVAATQASGTTVISNAEELKVKESNRLLAISTELNRMGADIQETEDGLVIRGGTPLRKAECQSYDDHRIAMSCAVAGLIARDGVVIRDPDCVDISFPGFFEILKSLGEN